jgi:hypothetical protein
VIVRGASCHLCRIVCLRGGEVRQVRAVRLIGGDVIRVAKGDVTQD